MVASRLAARDGRVHSVHEKEQRRVENDTRIKVVHRLNDGLCGRANNDKQRYAVGRARHTIVDNAVFYGVMRNFEMTTFFSQTKVGHSR